MKNKFDKATDSKVSHWVFIFLLVIICCMVMKVKSQNVAYLIWVDNGDLRNVDTTHVTSLDNVAKYYKYKVGHDLDTAKVFNQYPFYFRYETGNIIFYCEKKKVVFKKNGDIAFRTIKRKEKSYGTY